VDYTVAGSPSGATGGVDFTATSGTLTFPAGQTVLTTALAVPVLADNLDEHDETATVTLSNASNATISDADGTLTILDDDAPPSLSINDVTTTNESGNATFIVTLSSESGKVVTVDYASADDTATAGSDYTATSGILAFAAGETSKTFTIPILADSASEAVETATLTLSNAVDATISDASGTLSITDDDSEGLIIVQQTQHSGTSGSNSFDVLEFASITVTIDGTSVTPNPTSFTLSGGSANVLRNQNINLEAIPPSGTLTMNFTYSAFDESGIGTNQVDANEGPLFQFDLTTRGVDFNVSDIVDKSNNSDYIGNISSGSRTISFDYDSGGSSLSLTSISDPIIVDFGAPGIEISAQPFGTNFDLDVDGFAELLTWPGKEDALLVLDHDGSGTIEDGTEVVSPRFQNGYYSSSMDALFSLDTNADNVVDLDDAQFRDLMLWVDQDQDGISQPNELRSLDEEGLVSFNLNASSTGDQVDGRVITEQGSVVFTEGEIGTYVAASFREIGGRTGTEPTENLVVDPNTVVINNDRLSIDGDTDYSETTLVNFHETYFDDGSSGGQTLSSSTGPSFGPVEISAIALGPGSTTDVFDYQSDLISGDGGAEASSGDLTVTKANNTDSLLVLNEAGAQGDTEDVVIIRHQEGTLSATALTEELGVPAIHDDLSSGGTFYNTNIV
jgi:hypothetical protein